MRWGDWQCVPGTGLGPAAFALMLAAFPAHSDGILTTGEYKEACSQQDESWKSFCNGYAQAVIDIANATGTACVPAGTNRTDVVTAIEALTFNDIGTQKFPETQAAIMMALAVVNNIFPCDR